MRGGDGPNAVAESPSLPAEVDDLGAPVTVLLHHGALLPQQDACRRRACRRRRRAWSMVKNDSLRKNGHSFIVISIDDKRSRTADDSEPTNSPSTCSRAPH